MSCMDTAAGQVNVDVHEHFSINNHYSEKFECSIFSYHFQITYTCKAKVRTVYSLICFYSLSLPLPPSPSLSLPLPPDGQFSSDQTGHQPTSQEDQKSQWLQPLLFWHCPLRSWDQHRYDLHLLASSLFLWNNIFFFKKRSSVSDLYHVEEKN